MTLAELVYEQAKTLPDHLAREVLDFIGYLREKQDQGEWRDLMAAQQSALSALWDNADDDVWNDF